MPNIDLIDVPEFGPNDPYHFQYDNLPLRNLMRRQNIINLALDDLIAQMRDAIGTQGSLSNRLNQSINADGDIKVEAIDSIYHNIGNHTDDPWEDTEEYGNWVAERMGPFVRMEKLEADKLANIAEGATNFYLQVEVGDEVVNFDSSYLKLVPSSSVAFEIVGSNNLKAHLNFPTESVHRHYYNQVPTHADNSDPDYKNYKVNSLGTPFIDGSLRVYVNGLRLSETAIYIPGSLVNDPWILLSVIPDHANGTFILSNALSEEDVIVIDYDIPFIS